MQTRLSLAALLAALTTLGATASAQAASTAGYTDPGTITYTADPNQANSLMVTYPAGTPASTVVIQDTANPVTAGNACTQTNANTVTCTLLGAVALAIQTGDGPDTVAFSGPASTTALSGITIDGGAGSDTLHGPAADVATTFIGGTGNDSFDPNGVAAGHATVSYADGRTTGVAVDLAAHTGIGAGGEQDTIGAGIENVTGGAGNDTLVGDDQANALNGGDGNDVLRGAGGNDVLTGGNGTDTASYSDRAAGHGVTASIAGGGGEGAEHDTYATIENLQGGAGNDTLTGDGGANTLDGGAGDDTLADGDTGGSLQTANDVLIGGDGTDTVTYAARSDNLTLKIDGAADSGNQGAFPSAETDKIATDVENVTGGSGNDTITGDAADNVLDGGSGNDTLDGGLGADRLIGGIGTDTATYASRTTPVDVSLDLLANDGADGEKDNVDVENVIGGSGDDVLTGDGAANTLDGGAGDDSLDGGLGGDSLIGGPGEDVADYSLRTAPVNVSLDGTGSANDGAAGEGDKVQTEDVIGGDGNDALSGDSGPNVLVGGPGNDTLSGGDGNDVLVGEDGDDNLSGGAGNDDLGPGAGNDTVFGGSNPTAPADEDTLDLSDRTDPFTVDLAAGTAVSGTEHDVVDSVEDVVGGAGDDKISGDAGNNKLTGGDGVDVLDGRAGNDTLISRDTKADTDTCGDGFDSVTADVLDTVGADCENVDRGALPALTIDVVRVAEGNSGTTNATLTVTLSAASLAPVTVGYQSGGGNATAGSDYTAVSGTLTFPAGTTKQTITVPIVGDTAYEPDETLLVGLANPVNATLGTPAVGGVVIVNDDAKPAPPAAKCTVPNVVRHTLTYARSRITKAGCRVGTIKHRYSNTIAKGRISKQGPRAGTVVAAGTKVTLVQSKGQRSRKKQ